MRYAKWVSIWAAVFWTAVSCLGAESALFKYQGKFRDVGRPATGLYDFEFRLFDGSTGGSQVGPTLLLTNTPVVNGLFRVGLDFGAAAFEGGGRWLAFAARPSASLGSFSVLPMRQALWPVPQTQFALVAGSVTAGSVTASKLGVRSVTSEKLGAKAITRAKIGKAQAVASVNTFYDDVAIQSGVNTSLTTNGNRLRIHAAAADSSLLAIVKDRDGIGSGVDADFLDGKESALYGLELDAQGRVLKGGDTMSATLTLQPPSTAQALVTVGNRRGTWNDSVAYLSNRQNSTNNSPAVRIENTSGTSPEGVLSVSNNGDGQIARFGNSSRYVAALQTNGMLNVLPNAGATAIKVEGNKPAGHLLELRNAGRGSFALFGNATDAKLTIESDGTMFSRGSILAPGGMTVGGDMRVTGNLRLLNGSLTMPARGKIRIVGHGTPIEVSANGAVSIQSADTFITLSAPNLTLTARNSLNLLSPSVDLNEFGTLPAPADAREQFGPLLTYFKLEGTMRVQAERIRFESLSAIVKGGASELKLLRGPVTIKGAKVTSSTPVIVKKAKSL